MSNLLMISGDRSILAGKQGAFWYTLQELSKHWERIDVITPRSQESVARGQDFPNVFFHPSPKGLWYQPFWISKKGSALCADRKYDVMTIHEYPPFYNGIGALFLRRRCRIPSVLEIHHIVGDPVASSLTERVGKILSRIFLPIEARFVTAVRVVNISVLSRLASFGLPRKKMSVVSSFYLDPSILSPDASIEKKFDFVFCGRLVRNKGLMNLIFAVNAFPSATLLVIGDGPDRRRCEAEVRRLGLSTRVLFGGWLQSQHDVIRAIQSAKIFVLPSLSEGGPRVALEAMACGMPVISTRVGIMPDVIVENKNGVLADGSVRGLISSMQSLLMNAHLREEIGRNARFVLDKFERARLVREYAEFLKKTASSRSA